MQKGGVTIITCFSGIFGCTCIVWKQACQWRNGTARIVFIERCVEVHVPRNVLRHMDMKFVCVSNWPSTNKLNIWWVRKGWAWYWLVFASQPKSYSCILTTCYLPLRSYWGVVGLILFQVTATDSSAYMFNCGFSFMIKGLYKILIESFCLCLHTCISKCAWKCKVYVLLETLFT